MTTRPLAAPSAVYGLEVIPAIGSAGKRQRSNAWTLWGFIIMFIGVAIGVIGKKALHNEIITVVGILVSLVGMFLSVYPALAPSSRPKRNFIRAPQPEVLTPSPLTNSLLPESSIEYVPSATERTTELLENPAATKPRQSEDGETHG